MVSAVSLACLPASGGSLAVPSAVSRGALVGQIAGTVDGMPYPGRRRKSSNIRNNCQATRPFCPPRMAATSALAT